MHELSFSPLALCLVLQGRTKAWWCAQQVVLRVFLGGTGFIGRTEARRSPGRVWARKTDLGAGVAGTVSEEAE